MKVKAQIIIHHRFDNSDNARDWCESVKKLIDGKVNGRLYCHISETEPQLQLKQEKESE